MLHMIDSLPIVHCVIILVYMFYRSVTDPRDGKIVALKKIPNVFQNLISSKRVFREIKMLCFFKHENVSKHFNLYFNY